MPSSQEEPSNRRPLAVRELKLTKNIAVWLSRQSVTPNQISVMSVVWAIIGCAALYGYQQAPSWPILLLIGAGSIQARLLCNLFDGMVAVEGGKKTPAGEVFNDLPDRIADPLFIVAAGFITHSQYGMSLAWASALVAVLTAYIRLLGVSMGCPADFRGPMAKQHRMALLTFCFIWMFICRVVPILPDWFNYTLDVALLVMLIGGLVTCWRRTRGIFVYKRQAWQVAQGQAHE